MQQKKIMFLKKILFIFLLFLLLPQLIAGWGDFFKADKVTRELYDKHSYWFRDYDISIYNCNQGDGFEDISIPSSLRENFSENALKRYFKEVYDRCWREYEIQVNSKYWSWQWRSEFASIYEIDYFITIELTNVCSYPITEVRIVIDGEYEYKARARKVMGIQPQNYGKLDCKIPYDLYKHIEKGKSTANLKGLWYQ